MTSVRQRALMFAPIINNQVPGLQRYVCIVDTGGVHPYAVGTCLWDDTEWEAGRHHADLVAAIRHAADRMEQLQML